MVLRDDRAIDSHADSVVHVRGMVRSYMPASVRPAHGPAAAAARAAASNDLSMRSAPAAAHLQNLAIIASNYE
jgi:prephenate dehydratase